jgi:hypothetical protein
MTRKEYFDRFFELCELGKSYYQTYILLEKEHFRLFKRNKYKTYASFRAMKTYYLKDI